jgi:hypothetical protein
MIYAKYLIKNYNININLAEYSAGLTMLISEGVGRIPRVNIDVHRRYNLDSDCDKRSWQT